MKVTYLGTAAAEGFPALFCNCPACREAARLGGRNIRTRSQALINRDLLLDLPPDTYLHKLQNGLDLSEVRYLFVTHWHMDHFYPPELTVRRSWTSTAPPRQKPSSISWPGRPTGRRWTPSISISSPLLRRSGRGTTG